MTNTETFIEMVSKAEEIQGLWKPKIGDWHILKNYHIAIPSCIDDEIWEWHKTYDIKKRYAHIPTMEDLFGILHEHYPVGVYDTIQEFNDWLQNITENNIHKVCKSLKEALLYLIMEKIYNKQWRNKRWEVME